MALPDVEGGHRHHDHDHDHGHGHHHHHDHDHHQHIVPGASSGPEAGESEEGASASVAEVGVVQPVGTLGHTHSWPTKAQVAPQGGLTHHLSLQGIGREASGLGT